LTLDQALGDGWQQGLHPDDREKIFATWQAAMQKDQVWDHEYRFLGKDGRVTWLHGLTVKRTDLDGNLAGYIGINIDISKRKEVEDQLEDVNQRLQVLAENINQVIYLYDPASDQFLYVSPAYERIWEEPVEAVYDDPLSFAKKVHPDDLPAFQEAVRKEHEKCIFFDLEYRILPEKGSIKWIHSQNKPVLDENSDHILTVGITEDITDRKSAEDALRKSEEKFRLIADNSTEIIWQLDLKGKVTYISPSVTKITGYTREDLKGLIYRDIVSSSAVKQALKLFKAALSGEEFPLIVIDVKEKDGSI